MLKIHFRYEQQSIFQGFFSEADINAMAEATLNAPGWPATVNAWFNDVSHEFISGFDKRNFDSTIRPAPWEPLDTPSERRLPWPDWKYLDKPGSD